jgi:GNAT superfamily N-acetyltransferase
MEITKLSADECGLYQVDLSDLLIDAVDGGAAVSYLAPLGRDAADAFWQTVADDVAKGTRVVIVALIDNHVVGCVHLSLAMQPNGRHRAEIQKLLVHSAYRRRGVATALMAAAEAEAQGMGRSLLVLDTEAGGLAEQLYEQLGYQRAGVIPLFAASSSGGLHSTVLFYKHLGNDGGLAES